MDYLKAIYDNVNDNEFDVITDFTDKSQYNIFDEKNQRKYRKEYNLPIGYVTISAVKQSPKADAFTIITFYNATTLSTIMTNHHYPILSFNPTQVLRGNNVNQLVPSDRVELFNYYKQISGLDLRNSLVTGLHFNINLSLSQPVRNYLDNLQHTRGLKMIREADSNTVTYSNSLYTIQFYDLVASELKQAEQLTARQIKDYKKLTVCTEAKERKQIIKYSKKNTEHIPVGNILRIELRIENSINKLLKLENYVAAYHVYTAGFYNLISEFLLKKINKLNINNPLPPLERTMYEFKLLHAINDCGGIVGYEENLKRSKLAKKLNRSTIFRQIQEAREVVQRVISEHEAATGQQTLTNELLAKASTELNKYSDHVYEYSDPNNVFADAIADIVFVPVGIPANTPDFWNVFNNKIYNLSSCKQLSNN